ncbi:fimbria/pilus periplasmic chaperone [Pantoea sp. M_5]|uniref:fimbria/pilus periplasmic chaperone n=1 Tax=Pantoea sp. M_5 TaxID=2608038 RepID=UPI001231F150|nr:fimbria/pilus periplasmic chaperone [Pantoea sp. M_5]KAA5989649.1 fimbria/pilus periplasmic chaperone [Pantoea sp. M_5]
MSSVFRNTLCAVLVSASCLVSTVASAGGITLGATRVIYPAGQKQVSMSVHNTSDKSSFMVQSWVEDAEGKKSADFIVTPPLYVSGPGNENTLRIMYIGQPPRKEKESRKASPASWCSHGSRMRKAKKARTSLSRRRCMSAAREMKTP